MARLFSGTLIGSLVDFEEQGGRVPGAEEGVVVAVEEDDEVPESIPWPGRELAAEEGEVLAEEEVASAVGELSVSL